MEYQIKILLEQINEAGVWCKEQFGDRWHYDLGTFYFKREADAVAFKLRWT